MIETELPVRNKISVIQAHGRAKTIPAYDPQYCCICNQILELDETDLGLHLRRHLDEFYEREGGHRCDIFHATSTHKVDLKTHLRSAATRHCGFYFHH